MFRLYCLKYCANNFQTSKEDQAELANYDAKVYRASAQMADALFAELRGLRIPFFVLKQSLIQDSSTSATGDSSSLKSEDRVESGPSKLTKSELVDLQRRMLELLEDLCKE